jgi:hypothetical protein
MRLPPKDSPLWAQMEEDIAAERWSLPTLSPVRLFSSMYRGPANTLRRAVTFKMWMLDSVSVWRTALTVAFFSGLLLWFAFPGKSITLFRFTFGTRLPFMILGIAVIQYVTDRIVFYRSAHRYMEQHQVSGRASLYF